MADSTDYRKWISRANQDVKVVEIIKTEGMEGLEDSSCYMSHQASEKLLKSFLLYHSERLYRTHDLIYLLKKCTRYDKSLKQIFDDASVLNEYAVSTRYPSDFGDKRTLDEAKAAYTHMMNIKTKIMQSIKKDMYQKEKLTEDNSNQISL